MWIGDSSQIPRLFRKYARHLAPFILAVLTLQTALAVMTVRWVGIGEERHTPAYLLIFEFIVPGAWILLIGVLGQQDAPMREKEQILPFSWRCSLFAKIMVALCFLNLPVIISDMVILNALGLPFRMTHLLLRQLPLLAVVVIPALALSSISRSMWQYLLVILIALVVFFVFGQRLFNFIPSRPLISIPLLEGVPDIFTITVLTLSLLVLISFHFARPSTATRRIVALGVTIVLQAICFATHLGPAHAFFVASRPELNSRADWAKAISKLKVLEDPDNQRSDWWAGIGLPIGVDGLPPKLHLRGQGETQIDGLPRPVFTFLLYNPDRYGDYRDEVRHSSNRMTVCFGSERDPFRGRNVSIHSSLEVWAFEEKTTYTATLGRRDLIKIPGVGLCRWSLNSGLNCWFGPLRPVDVRMRIPEEIHSWPVVFSAFFDQGSIQPRDEIIWGFTPIEKSQESLPEGVKEVILSRWIPVGTFHTTVSIEQFPISEYGIHKALTEPLE